MIDDYSKLSIGKYLEILDVLETESDDIDKYASIVAVLDDMEVDAVLDLPLTDFSQRCKDISFLFSQPEKVQLKDRYRLGKYDLDLIVDLKKITAGQYIDYMSFMKTPDKYLVEILSVFLVPRGKKYNQGYDISDVQSAIRTYLTVDQALSMSAFFLTLCRVLIETTLTSLERKIRKMEKKGKPTEDLQKVLTNLQKIGDMYALSTEYLN